MSNKFKIGDEVLLAFDNSEYPILHIEGYNGKSGIIKTYFQNGYEHGYSYNINIEGTMLFLPENMLRFKAKPTEEEQSLRELLIRNREVLLGNRKAIDESLELIETMLNK